MNTVDVGNMEICTVWFEAADGYSIKPPLPTRVYKPTLFGVAAHELS